jgi:hypothetical protein
VGAAADVTNGSIGALLEGEGAVAVLGGGISTSTTTTTTIASGTKPERSEYLLDRDDLLFKLHFTQLVVLLRVLLGLRLRWERRGGKGLLQQQEQAPPAELNGMHGMSPLALLRVFGGEAMVEAACGIIIQSSECGIIVVAGGIDGETGARAAGAAGTRAGAGAAGAAGTRAEAGAAGAAGTRAEAGAAGAAGTRAEAGAECAAGAPPVLDEEQQQEEQGHEEQEGEQDGQFGQGVLHLGTTDTTAVLHLHLGGCVGLSEGAVLSLVGTHQHLQTVNLARVSSIGEQALSTYTDLLVIHMIADV